MPPSVYGCKMCLALTLNTRAVAANDFRHPPDSRLEAVVPAEPEGGHQTWTTQTTGGAASACAHRNPAAASVKIPGASNHSFGLAEAKCASFLLQLQRIDQRHL
ncbi:hypothetical protein BD414DRAFT_109099 [Trametes punicea]|nr:hypothetical protein BD414DRAFT_109099 [Trametes punicea]